MDWRFHTFSSCFFFLLLLLDAAAAAAPAPVRVGVILSSASVSGMSVQTSIRMAVDDYYAARPSSGTRVELHFRDSSGDAVEAVAAAGDLIKNARVHAIIGPQAPAAAELVAAVGSRARVPVVSYSAASPPLSPSDARFLVRACPDDSSVAEPVAAVLGSFGWRSAIVLHEDSRLGVGVVAALGEALQGVGASIPCRVAVPHDASDDRLDAGLYRATAATTARVFVVHTSSPSLARRMFRRAREAGMMSRGYVWIAAPAVEGGEDRLASDDDIKAMQGVLVVRPHVQPTWQGSNFATRFRARFRRENAGSPDAGAPTLPMLLAYDTAWAVAAAAEASLTSPGAMAGTTEEPDKLAVSFTGETLLKALHDTTFDGLAGEFRLVDGKREMPAYEILNVVAEGTRTVGFWTAKTRTMAKGLDTNVGRGLDQIIWPGETSASGVPPKGWAVSPSGRDLVVAVPVKHGFNQFVDVRNDPTSGRQKITGYCIDVFDAAIKALPYPQPVSYHYVPFNGSSDSYDQLVQLVPQQRADAVVGDVSITWSRMGEVEYTMPFSESGWSMVVPVQAGASTSMFFFLKPLTASLWITSLAFFVITGFVVWVIEHRINPEFRGAPWQQFGIMFYYAFSTLVFAQKEKLESNLSRFLVIIWVFVVLILTSSYTASLTSMLTVQKLQPSVTDVKDLVGRGEFVGYQEGSFVRGELEKMGFAASKLRSYSTPDQYADALSRGSANGGVAAVFDEIPYLRLFLAHYCDGYDMAGPVYSGAGFGFIFPKGSPMASDVSRAVVSMTEGDDMALIERKWFGEPGACDGGGGGGGGGGGASSSLSFWSFSGLFLVTGLATGGMLIVYLATFVYRERDELRAAEPADAGSVSLRRRLRAWLRHYDRKDLRSPSFSHLNGEGSARSGADTKQGQEAGKGGEAKTPFEQRAEEAAMAAPGEHAASAPAEGKPSLQVLMNSEENKEE
ncbi:hypothetical protein ACP4OV_006596 [Aristida adscensionis]